VEVKLLLAGYGLTVFGSRVEGPLLHGRDDGFVDAVAEAAGHFDVGDLSGGVDDDVEDDIAFCASGKSGEVRLGRGKVADESDVDVAFAEGVCAGGGVGLRGGGGLRVGRGCGFFQLRLGWSGERGGGFGLFGSGFGVGCGGLHRGAAGRVGEQEVGAVLAAGQAQGSDPGGALMDQDSDEEEVQHD